MSLRTDLQKVFNGNFQANVTSLRVLYLPNCPRNTQMLGIVPFVATLLKGRFVVFLKWLLIGYFRIG